jgi:aspartate dehydrogenase
MKRIGLIGFGTIGTRILQRSLERNFATVDFVLSRRPRDLPAGVLALTDLDAALARPVDLLVEVATPELVAAAGERLLAHAPLMLFSLTSLADDPLRRRLEGLATASGHPLFIPHGAVLGLDGLRAGRGLIASVRITTTKHPGNLSGDAAQGLLYEGPTRGACAQFPRNVNVHAAVALAGIGFDRTESRVVADPERRGMRHHIEVEGTGLKWEIITESPAAGSVTSAFTPESAAVSVERALTGAHGSVLI